MLDRAKLTKLLAMTTSDSDGEALNALRLANRMLTAEKLTWEEVLSAPAGNMLTVTVTRHPGPGAFQDADWVAPHLKDRLVIEIMFRAIFAQPRSDNEEFWQFMDSIHNRWQQYHNLSQGQYDALKRSYNRVRRA